MAFPVNGVLDTFTGTNGTDLNVYSANWQAAPTGNSTLEIQDNAAAGSASGGDHTQFWSTAFGPDCETYVTFNTYASNVEVDLYLRSVDETSLSTLDCYACVVYNGTIRFWKIINGTPTALGSSITQTVSNGDSVGASVVGSTLRAYYKASGGSWAQIGSDLTDTALSAAGKIGLYVYSNGSRLDNFGGGTLSSGATAKTATGSLNAAIQSAKTATASMSSAIRLARTATGSVGAAVAVRNTATASAGAAVLAAKTASGSLSAAVQVLRATNTSAGAAVAVQNTSSASLGSAVAVQSTVSSSLGSVIQVARSASASLSAALQAAASVNASTSAAVQTSSTVSANLEAALQAAHAANQSLDTAILFEASVTASVNAYINDTSITAVTASLNAAVQQALSATANLQAAVQLSQTLSTSLDSALQVSGSLSASLDADIFAGFFATASLDAAIQNASSAAASLDAYISDGVTISSVGGWMPSRKTKEQRDKERRELGILPEIEVPVTAAEVRELTHEDRQRAQRAAGKLLERFAPEPTAPVAAVALPAPNEQPTIGPVELPVEVQATLIAAQKKRAFEQDLVYIVATLIS